eukprot:1155857-Pelagomonas_calceolata.AAC.3
MDLRVTLKLPLLSEQNHVPASSQWQHLLPKRPPQSRAHKCVPRAGRTGVRPQAVVFGTCVVKGGEKGGHGPAERRKQLKPLTILF